MRLECFVDGSVGDVVHVVGKGLEGDGSDDVENLAAAVAGVEKGVEGGVVDIAPGANDGEDEVAQDFEFLVFEGSAVAE